MPETENTHQGNPIIIQQDHGNAIAQENIDNMQPGNPIIIQQDHGNAIAPENIDNMQPENLNTRTYSDDEINNPAVIDVTIADTKTPIVVLFGPPQSGKTMTMIRLAEYLTHPDRGYTVAPDRAFRKAFDETYRINCDNFNGMLNSIWAAEKSKGLEFMQLVVSKDGRPIVQILEAPGEHYYDPVDPNEPKVGFLPYITKVIQSPNRKIWVYLTEPNWKDQDDRMKYAKKVHLMKRSISRRDKSIILFNKVDATNLFYSTGEVNHKEAERFVDSQYPGLFRCFKNENPITSLWRKYNCTLIPFVTGSYNNVLVDGKNTQRYVAGPDRYPRVLWDNILSSDKKISCNDDANST